MDVCVPNAAHRPVLPGRCADQGHAGSSDVLDAFPDATTIAESGHSGFEASARTPGPNVERLHAEVQKALATPEAKECLTAVGGDVTPGGGTQLATPVRSERPRHGKLVQETDVKPGRSRSARSSPPPRTHAPPGRALCRGSEPWRLARERRVVALHPLEVVAIAHAAFQVPGVQRRQRVAVEFDAQPGRRRHHHGALVEGDPAALHESSPSG